MFDGLYLNVAGLGGGRFTGAAIARRVLRLAPYIPPALTFAALPYVFRTHRGGPATGLMEIQVRGLGGGVWTLEILPDDVTVLPGPAVGAPDSRLITDVRTWTALAAGRTNGTEAFMRGRLEVEGDIALTLKLDACFS